MRADHRPYFDGRAVGIVVSAYGAQALGTTLVGVRSIVHALRGWPTPFAAALNAQNRPFENGLPANADVAGQLETVARQVHGFALAHHAANENPIATRLKAAVGT
jgi:FMN reductase